MGQKVNPIGLRLGKQKKWESNWFSDAKDYDRFLHTNFLLEKYVQSLLRYNFNKKHIIVKTSLVKTGENKLYYVIFFYRLRNKLVQSKISNPESLTKTTFLKKSDIIINYPFFKLKKFNSLNFRGNFKYKKFLYLHFKNTFLTKTVLSKLDLRQNLKLMNILSFGKTSRKNSKSGYGEKSLLVLRKLLLTINKDFLLALKKKEHKKVLFFKTVSRKIRLLLKLVLLLKVKKKFSILSQKSFSNSLLSFLSELPNKKALFKNLINQELSHELNLIARLVYLKKEHSALVILNSLKKSQQEYIIDFFLYLLLNHEFSSLQKSLNAKGYLNDEVKLMNIINYPSQFKSDSSKQGFEGLYQKELRHLTNSEVRLMYINTLSFLKYQAFSNKNNVNRLTILEKNLTRFYRSRFKLSLIQQFVYGGFISVFFKNPSLLGQIIVEGIETLPKFRKHGQYFKFLSDMINALINSQKEIIGFRIQLKGRFNKWRRTKSVYINRGRLPLRIHDTQISYSSSYGCIRRGLFGVKIWICYEKNFSNKLEMDIKNYLLYSKTIV